MRDTLGARVRALRGQKGWTQDELSERSEVSRVTIARIESGAGKTYPTTDIVMKLAACFDVTSDYLLGKSDDPNPSTDPDSDLWELREQLRRTPEMRTLFDMSKKATREDIEKTIKILKTLKGED